MSVLGGLLERDKNQTISYTNFNPGLHVPGFVFCSFPVILYIDMSNKILILLMSCNQPLYEQEEQACRDTFLKDAEGAGLSYYFYKGGSTEISVNQESHTMYLPVPDGLQGTSEKTTIAFNEVLKLNDWDYIVKTNVSTWLDIEKILNVVDKWEGREDRNIYGARYLANDASKNVPFPRGHFIILSRSLVEGIVEWAPKLIKATGMPKTDDTLLCLSLLYYTQKILGDTYQDRLMEVPSVNSLTEPLPEAQEWPDALSIRCKDEINPENTPNNIRKVHKLKRSLNNQMRMYRRPMGITETKYGLMNYGTFAQLCKILNQIKQ